MHQDYDEQLEAYLDAAAEHAARLEEGRYAFECGLACEAYLDIIRAKGHDHLLAGFIDMFIDNIDFDICDESLEREFENGCPTAARYRKKDGEFSDPRS